jgi:hypothetical protein
MTPVFYTCTTLSARNCHICISSGKHVLFLCDSLQAFVCMADKTIYLITFIIFALFFKHAWRFIFWTKIFFPAQCSNLIRISSWSFGRLFFLKPDSSGGSVWLCFRRKLVILWLIKADFCL